jgi:hypothetical protein
MRLAVSETGYASAVDAFATGNELAARAASGLADRLASYSGMAGNDSTAEDFASAYDAAARSTVAALTPLVGSFGSLARMTEASLANHAHAERESVLPAWSRSVDARAPGAVGVIGVRLAAPPSALGASDTPPGGAAGMVLDLLQDVFWPNADTDRVRSAATVWRSAAAQVRVLTAHCDAARWALDDERSPEIPVALSVTDQVRDRSDALADQLAALADACDAYAAQVEAKRAELIDLLEDLVKEFVVGGLIVGGLSFLSGGLASGLGGSAAAARIASASRDFRAILDSLRVLSSGTATTLRPVAVEAGALETSLGRTAGARVMLMEGGGEGAASATTVRSWTSFLSRYEGPTRGHTLRDHVGKSWEFLHQRVLNHPTAPHASSFADEASAARCVETSLKSRAGSVDEWLNGSAKQLRIDHVLDDVTGISVNRAGEIEQVKGIRLILVRDPSMPEGYWIKTSFPQPVKVIE